MNDDNLQIEIDQLKRDVFSDDWELVKSSVNRLGQIGGDEIVDFLISLISLEDSSLRNRAALALYDIKDNKALEPLLDAIFKKENHNFNGTMVFALESLDCRKKLKEIFRILFYQTYESKISAYSIISDQIFEFTRQDLIEIKQMWEDCKLHPEKCPYFEDKETREMMQDAVDGYMGYLNQKPINHKKGKHKKPSS